MAIGILHDARECCARYRGLVLDDTKIPIDLLPVTFNDTTPLLSLLERGLGVGDALLKPADLEICGLRGGFI